MTRSTRAAKTRNESPSPDVWAEILSAVKLKADPLSFKTWLGPSRLMPSSNGKLRVQLPNQEFIEYVSGKWLHEILQIAKKKGFPKVEFYPEMPEAEQPAAETAEAPEADEERSARFDSTRCPQVPEECWYGTAKIYRDVIGHRVESSDNFHLACFLTLVGSLLGKSVFINAGRVAYPNFYTVIVGESAWSAKGTAMSPMEDIPEQINPAVIPLKSLDSSEGLIRAIEESRSAAGHGNEGCVLVVIDEFNAVLEKAKIKGSKLIPDLKKAFDSPPVLEINTSKRSRVSRAPTISILAASETDDLADMRDRDRKGGLGNRLIYVPGEPKAPNARSSMPMGEEWEPLVKELRKVIEFYQRGSKVQLRWGPDAHAAWEKFYTGARKRGADDPLISKLASRHRAYVPRIATVYAALDMETEFIRLPHLQAAIAYADFLLDSLYYIFRNADIKPWVREERDIVDYVERKGAVRLRPLRNRFHRMGSETFDRRMKYLVADDAHPDRLLRKEQRVGDSGRATVWVVPND